MVELPTPNSSASFAQVTPLSNNLIYNICSFVQSSRTIQLMLTLSYRGLKLTLQPCMHCGDTTSNCAMRYAGLFTESTQESTLLIKHRTAYLAVQFVTQSIGQHQWYVSAKFCYKVLYYLRRIVSCTFRTSHCYFEFITITTPNIKLNHIT